MKKKGKKCANGHQSITYESSEKCPLCEAIEIMDKLEGRLEALEIECNKLEDEIKYYQRID